MKKISAISVVIVTISSLAFGYEIKVQDATDKLVGTWKSDEIVNGEPQAVLTINRIDNKLSGSFVFRGVTVEGRENVTLELALSNLVFDGTTLSCRVTIPETKKVMTDWALRLLRENEASFDLTKEEGESVEDAPSFRMKRAKGN